MKGEDKRGEKKNEAKRREETRGGAGRREKDIDKQPKKHDAKEKKIK